MKVKKSKGFTLIELLAVIVIVGILITLVSIGVARYVKTSKEKVKVQAAEEIIEIAKAYMATNNVYAVDVKTLIDEGYLANDATNPETGENDLSTKGKDFWIIRCKDDSTLDTTITNCGFSNGKYYLSINSELNDIISELDPEDKDDNHYLKYNDGTITIINNVGTGRTIVVDSNDTDSTKKSTTSSKADKTDSTKKSTTSSKINNTKENTISKTTTKKSTTTTKSSEPSTGNGNLCDDDKFKPYCNVELKSSSSGTEVNKVKSYTIDDRKYNFKYKVTATNNYSSSWLSPKYCELKFSDSQFWYGSNGYNSTKTKIVDGQIDKSEFKDRYLTLKVDSTNKKIILVSKNNTCTLTLISVTKAE